MKISEDLALKYLGNPKFCSSQEAIAYAKIIDDPDTFKKVLDRIDVQKYLESMSSQSVITYAKNNNHWFLWKTILIRKDIPFQKAITFAKLVGHSSVWRTVLLREDIPPRKVIIFAKEVDNYRVWEKVLDRIDVQKYLGSMSPEKVITYAKKVGSGYLLKSVLEREDVEKYLE